MDNCVVMTTIHLIESTPINWAIWLYTKCIVRTRTVRLWSNFFMDILVWRNHEYPHWMQSKFSSTLICKCMILNYIDFPNFLYRVLFFRLVLISLRKYKTCIMRNFENWNAFSIDTWNQHVFNRYPYGRISLPLLFQVK